MKVLKTKEFLLKETDGKWENSRDLAIITEGNKVVITDWEYIHSIENRTTDTTTIDLYKVVEGGFSCFSAAEMVVTIDELLKSDFIVEMEPSDFFRHPNYNSRLASNFRGFCRTMREIGYPEFNSDSWVGKQG